MTEHMDPTVRAALLRAEQQKTIEPTDPAIREAVRRIEQRERDADRRAAEAEQRRQEAVRAELEAEKQRRLEAWMASGNDPDAFQAVWAKQREEIFMAQQAQLRRQSSVF